MSVAQKKRFLIWGKTAPELSTKYYETVCTVAVLADGTPIRLYPIPFRYLKEEDKFKKYQWMTAAISRNTSDPRPESYRIDCDSIELGNLIRPDNDEWGQRAAVLFQQAGFQFDSLEALTEAQKRTKQSLGVMTPKEILSVTLRARPPEELKTFEEKKAAIKKLNEADRAQLRVFEECMPDEMKSLDCQKNRIQVQWKCGSGSIHKMQILDWEVAELQRKSGDKKALNKVRDLLDLNKYATRFFLGNLKQHPPRFTIVGLWYPKKASMKGRLF